MTAGPSQHDTDRQHEPEVAAMFPYFSRTTLLMSFSSMSASDFFSAGHHDGFEEVLHLVGEEIRLDEGEAAELPVFLPADQGQLVPRADLRPVAELLGENHLPPLADSDEGLHAAAARE